MKNDKISLSALQRMKNKYNKNCELCLPIGFRTFFDLANILLIVLDANQRVAMINPKGCKILGYPEAEIIGQKWFENFIPNVDRKKTMAVFKKLMKGELEPVAIFKNHIMTKEGKKRLILWHNTYLRGQSGKIGYTYSAGADITDIIKA